MDKIVFKIKTPEKKATAENFEIARAIIKVNNSYNIWNGNKNQSETLILPSKHQVFLI
jgi:hypothetical protein